MTTKYQAFRTFIQIEDIFGPFFENFKVGIRPTFLCIPLTISKYSYNDIKIKPKVKPTGDRELTTTTNQQTLSPVTNGLSQLISVRKLWAVLYQPSTSGRISRFPIKQQSSFFLALHFFLISILLSGLCFNRKVILIKKKTHIQLSALPPHSNAKKFSSIEHAIGYKRSTIFFITQLYIDII